MKKIILLFIYTFFGILSGYSQCWKVLESGANHTVAIHQNGTLWAWGSNSQGEIGDGTTNHSNVPKLINSSTNWVSISAGHAHNSALKSDGTIWVWGYDVFNALGLGGVTQVNNPTRIGTASNWVSISAGHDISFAIKVDGSLWGWGLNLHGEVGDGTITPKLIPTRIGIENNWKKVYAGDGFVAAIKTDGTLWTWGNNGFGELGIGNYFEHYTPIQVGTDTNWLSVSPAMTFGLGLKTNGTIWAWGSNSTGEFGNGTFTSQASPIQLGTDTDWKKIETGNSNSFFIKNNGTLWSCGYNFAGMLGNGTVLDSNVLTQLGTDTDWVSVSSQLFQTIALKNNNIGYGWGSNYFGQIGNGYTDNALNDDPNDYTFPVKINCPCINNTLTPTFTVPQTVCLGSTSPILPTTSVNGVSGTWLPSLISNTSSDTYIFTPDNILFPCAAKVSLPIVVAPVETPTFNAIPLQICQYSNAPTLPANSTNLVPIAGVWNPSNVNTTIVGQSTYTFLPNTGQCASVAPYEITIDVTPSTISNFDPINPICTGTIPPVLSNVAPNGVSGTWSPSIIDNTTSGDYEFTPSGTGCVITQKLHVTVLPLIVPNFRNLPLCKGDTSVVLETTSPNGITGTWLPSTIDATADGNYLFTPNPFQCSSNQTITVTIHESMLQSVDYTVSDAFAENSTLSIFTLPVGNYLYQLDGGAFQTDSTFQNVSLGQHYVTVTDVEGCNNVVKIEGIQIIDYPKYFTPNGDGYNDYWKIIGLDSFSKSILYIYDRYGKLLKQIDYLSQGWDGTYNGKPLPSSDYWFRIDYYENNVFKQYNSHFALKR